MNDFISFFLAPIRYRPIMRQFLRREILGRYRGSMLGLAWAFITPLLMLGVYSLVFVGIFSARWPGAEAGGGIEFALRLFVGLVVFNLFAEVTGRAPTIVVEQPNLVKKVAFPVELLSFVTIGSALFHFFLSTGILLICILLVHHTLPVSALLFPIVILPILPLLLGLSWFLAALGVYVRDVIPVVGLGISLLLFLSPVFYSTHSLSPRWQAWIQINPLTPIIENLRAILFLGQMPNWHQWGISLLLGIAAALLGARVFNTLKNGFADAL